MQYTLLTQIHLPSAIQLIELIVFQIIYKQNAFSCGFHFWPQSFVHIVKLAERDN